MTMRLISKVKPGELAERPGSPRWRAQHPDGAVTYHKTLKDAKEYWHTSENTASYFFRKSIVDATWRASKPRIKPAKSLGRPWRR